MEVQVGIYGKDYSPVCFEKYDRQHNQGIRFEGVDYEPELAKLVVQAFLECENRRIRNGRYKVGRNDERTDFSSLSLCAEYAGQLYYQNIVGVLSTKEYRLSEEMLERYAMDVPDEKKQEYMEHIYHVQLQIGSRFDGEHTYFLPTMFKSGTLDINEYQVPRSDDALFDFLLVFDFVRVLKRAYTNGVFRSYQRFQRNDSHIRGSVQIARHIRLNAGLQNGCVAYTYRENTADNAMNYLILYTYELIKKKFGELAERLIGKDYHCQKILNEIQIHAKTYRQNSLRKVMQQCSNPISQPYYMDYEMLRQICLQLLKHMGISVFDGVDEDKTEGILYYIPDLWEDFLEKIIKKHILGYELESQKEVKVFQEKGKYAHSTYPDYVFSYMGKPIFVLDAKFKEKWESGFDLNDYTKCIRDMNSLAVHATGVIYPVKNNVILTEEYVKHAISEYNQRDHFFKLPIYVPSSEGMDDYMEWLEKLENSVAGTMQALEICMNEEMERV